LAGCLTLCEAFTDLSSVETAEPRACNSTASLGDLGAMPKTITWPTQPDDFLIIYSYLGAEPPAFGLLYCTCVKRPVLRGSYIVLSMSHGGGMSIPLRQKAAVLEQCHSSVKLSVDTDYGVPLLERGQLLIKNSLCGVNLVDTQFCGGFHSIAKPTIPGHEATGTVAALGPGTSTSGFKVGERVIWVYTGGYAEYSAVPVDNIFKLPRYITDQDALGGLLHGLTALTLVKDAYPVKKGEWVLVHAAQRNIGLLMVQILKAAGAKVIATVHRTAHLSLVKTLGADAVVHISKMKDKEMEWLKTVKDTTKGNGVSVVYDFVGKDTWKKSLEAVKLHGTVVLCGSLSGTVPPIPPQ
jgi:NADPH2:quinone reductase